MLSCVAVGGLLFSQVWSCCSLAWSRQSREGRTLKIAKIYCYCVLSRDQLARARRRTIKVIFGIQYGKMSDPSIGALLDF
ncbi:hypothetical protein NDU88_001161 [Pleurodeles waltl]|uniref:Secreted protein n=1 Tax=Pleurodeles waltl TaxID=8319 RepID=A0AAV7LX11_PLEWA|nr:hypothetical protein NDU88_001161 [Pleurodeles waltl]